MKKNLYLITLLTLIICSFCLAGWQAFSPPENPTFTVIENPHATVTLNQETHWKLKWTPTVDILPGSIVQLRSKNLRVFYSWQYMTSEITPGDITMRRPVNMSNHYLFQAGPEFVIFEAKIQNGLKKGEPLFINLSVIPPFHDTLDEAVSIWIDRNPDDDKQEFEYAPAATAVLNIHAGPVERIGVYCRPMPGEDGKVQTVIAPEDRYGNISSFVKPVTAELKWQGRTWQKTITGRETISLPSPDGIDRLTLTIPLSRLGTNDNITNAKLIDGKLVVTSNPVWPAAPHGMKAAFGEFHWHTEASGDGAGNIYDSLTHARDHLNMDYCSTGDHTPYHPKWKWMVNALEKFNQPGVFATFFGWENSTRHGHDNYYFTDPEHPVKPHGTAEVRHKKPYEIQEKLGELYTSLDNDNKFIAIPHHTNAVAETRKPDGTPYWYAYPFYQPDEYHRLFEILQTRGNMERNEYSDAWRGWYTYGSSAQDALAAGYKIGFTAGTDNHHGKPGVCFAAKDENRGRIPAHSQALTGLWTPRLERQQVFNSLHDRRTWAVWDTRAIVYFTVNDTLSGSELVLPKSRPLTARIKMSTDAPLQILEIISDSKTVWSATKPELDFDLTASLPAPDKDTHYYLRALDRSGGIIYASPVFVIVR